MSRYTNFQNDKLTVVSGVDHILGKFIQLYDKDVETPDGEGIVLDWSEGFGVSINFTGSPVKNRENEVMRSVEDYLKERVDGLVIISAQQSFSLN